jgi:hypothetical protein
MVWLERTIGAVILVILPVAWGLAMAGLFTRRKRTSGNSPGGKDA